MVWLSVYGEWASPDAKNKVHKIQTVMGDETTKCKAGQEALSAGMESLKAVQEKTLIGLLIHISVGKENNKQAKNEG